ncbi:MAG: alpha amylase C-terminal domain-containing protein [Bacteroidales bacterium]|nr:alpha amylase C-terminal domain-containing protein [Bacteroidales bacterium]
MNTVNRFSVELVKKDPYLKPFTRQLQKRRERATLRELSLTDGACPLSDIANGHLYYGLHKTDKGWVFREKAPNAKAIYLYGDFSRWEIQPSFSLTPLGNGDWEIQLPDFALKHGMLYKLWMVWSSGADERLPSYATRVVQDEQTKVFCAQVWDPEPYQWKHPNPAKPAHPLIYEAHVGMSSSEAKISSYWEFKETVIPRIQALGYNTIQLMAIQEHPYYGSFGYQVSNFFAPSSRFGTPEELKELIDTAHAAGISVILDVIHSHSVRNEKEGLSLFDGSDHLYFHSGEKGQHPVWDSRCFDYGKTETIQFLLSNLKYWLEEFHFDGFRFDGVTSMCYWDHGLGVDFVDYDQYFDDNVDEDALVYLTLANNLVRSVRKDAMTIAEDVSGMPGMAFPTRQGGIGFDYRMSMGIADYWVKTVKKLPDEAWGVGDIYFHLTDKRNEEETISYVECHDQAMVGDKTLIFRLIDKEMYDKMSVLEHSLLVDRGVALHKMIRLITLTLASGGYLNFMGNEFGHPEWIDFPREGNGWSYQYARRQWNLADDNLLKYSGLNRFDRDMVHLVNRYHLLDALPQKTFENGQDQVLVYERHGLLFVFNFNPTQSFADYEIPCRENEYRLLLSSDDKQYHGFGNVEEGTAYPSRKRGGQRSLKLYIPSRTALVLGSANR